MAERGSTPPEATPRVPTEAPDQLPTGPGLAVSSLVPEGRGKQEKAALLVAGPPMP